MDRSDIEKKWIIEIPKTANKIIVVGVYGDKEVYAYSVDVHDLDSYAEPDTEKVREEAYRQGYDTGYGTKVNEFYEQGLADAWEAARKIVCRISDGGYTQDLLDGIFGSHNYQSIMAQYSASDAVEKISKYEPEEQIQVGDEVKWNGDEPDAMFVVTHIDENGYISGINSEEMRYARRNPENWTKTGRRFPELVELLRKMKEES